MMRLKPKFFVRIFIGSLLLFTIIGSIIQSISNNLFINSSVAIFFFSLALATLLTMKYYESNETEKKPYEQQQEKVQIQETEKAIIKNAQMRAEQITRSAQQKNVYINSEIGKKDFYYAEVRRIKEEIADLEKKLSNKQAKMNRLMAIQKSIEQSLKTYFKSTQNDFPYVLPHELIAEIESLAPSVMLQLHSMDYPDLRKAYRANDKVIDETLKRYEDRYTTKTNRTIYQLMVIALRAELQNILYTLKYSKLDEAIAKVKEISIKYLNIAQDGNRNISSTLVRFIGETEPLFIDAVKIEYEYYVKREAARQEQMELQAQMRAEAEELARLKEQQEQMEREEAKYTGEIENLQQQIQETHDEERIQQLLARISELESQKKDLEGKKEEIVRLQTGKAGYVYIISNLGSFGSDIFKIGMTRRLDPQERVDELSGTSVPFKFDVHSFIFSQDAVRLEASLHTALNDSRVNKVNLRKEFFRVSLDELENLVNEIEPSAPFNRTMLAEQYHQSLSMQNEAHPRPG